MAAVAIELMISRSPRLEREDGARAVTNSTNIGVTDPLGYNGVMQGPDCGPSFEVMDKSFSLPGTNDDALPSFMTGETGRKGGNRGRPEQRVNTVTGGIRLMAGISDVTDDRLDVGHG